MFFTSSPHEKCGNICTEKFARVILSLLRSFLQRAFYPERSGVNIDYIASTHAGLGNKVGLEGEILRCFGGRGKYPERETNAEGSCIPMEWSIREMKD